MITHESKVLQGEARDKLARLCGMTRAQVDAFFQFQDERNAYRAALVDFVALAENEVQRQKTGYSPGPAMRDILGQWEATIREAKKALA